jgi:hypothetical protein
MLCQLDKAKGLELGETYLNEKAALGTFFMVSHSRNFSVGTPT